MLAFAQRWKNWFIALVVYVLLGANIATAQENSSVAQAELEGTPKAVENDKYDSTLLTLEASVFQNSLCSNGWTCIYSNHS